MGIVKTDVLITDLRERVIKGKVADKRIPNCWRVIPYQAEGFEGIAVSCYGSKPPKPLILRLGVDGPYRISFVINFFGGGIQVKLTGERYFQTLTALQFEYYRPLGGSYDRDPRPREVLGLHDDKWGYYEDWWNLQEIFWREADLTGRDLILGLDPDISEDSVRAGNWLGAIRLEPLERLSESKSEVQFPLAIFNDGGVALDARTPEDLVRNEALTIPEDSCTRIMIWGSGDSDVCNYPTKVGTPYGESTEGYTKAEAMRIANVQAWHEKGWDSMAVMRDYAKGRGWEFHAYVRINGFMYAYPFDHECWRSGFFDDHPQHTCLDKEGNRVLRLSYAYPEVREHYLALYREILSYNPDGICICFIRGCPMVLYEPIMVEGFMRRHGVDPRLLDEMDDRWIDYCAEVITEFMKQVKALLKPGQRLSAVVHGTYILNRRWGLDIRRWIREGIVDDYYITGHIYNEHDGHWEGGPEDLGYDYFQSLPGREKVRLFPMFYCWARFAADPQKHREAFWSYFDRGADGYAVWDAAGRTWAAMQAFLDIGCRERRPWVPRTRMTRKHKLLKMSGYRWDRYTPIEGW